MQDRALSFGVAFGARLATVRAVSVGAFVGVLGAGELGAVFCIQASELSMSTDKTIDTFDISLRSVELSTKQKALQD